MYQSIFSLVLCPPVRTIKLQDKESSSFQNRVLREKNTFHKICAFDLFIAGIKNLQRNPEHLVHYCFNSNFWMQSIQQGLQKCYAILQEMENIIKHISCHVNEKTSLKPHKGLSSQNCQHFKRTFSLQ